LYIGKPDTGEKTDYSRNFDQNSEHLTWSENSGSVYFISNIQGTDEIFRLDLSDGMIRRITDGTHNYSTIALAGDRIVATKTSMSQPAELFSVDPSSGNDILLTSINKGYSNNSPWARWKNGG
jgi:Tol biopolymer transport system component